MSKTIDPVGSATGKPAPIATAIGSSIKNTSLAPALSALSRIALRSTCVDSHGTQIIILGLPPKKRFPRTFLMKYLSICSVTLKSAITPSFIGLIALIVPGVRPSIRFASDPTAITFLTLIPPPADCRIATTEGSFKTMPFSFT